MKTFCKLTAQSPAASYVPLPRFLLQDEALRDISNDAKVLYALLLDRASISRQNGYVEPVGTIGNEFVKMISVSFLNLNVYPPTNRPTSRACIFLETPYSKASSHFPIASH